MWQCSRNHDNKEEAKFCGKCGERRVVAVFCTECGTQLEAGDVFCTSCGHAREDAPAQIPAAPVLPLPAPVVVEKAAPPPPPPPPQPVVEAPKAAPVVEQHTTHQTVPYLNPDAEIQPRSEDEPVTFSFGGAIIEMKDDTKPEKSAQASGGRMSSAQTAILSFALFAAVLGLALYFVSR